MMKKRLLYYLCFFIIAFLVTFLNFISGKFEVGNVIVLLIGYSTLMSICKKLIFGKSFEGKDDSPTNHSVVKITWYQQLCYRSREFLTKVKVAFHRPYMIKAIFTTKCPGCRRWLAFPKIVSQRTAYHDWYANYVCLCKHCREMNDEYWNELWEDYYNRLL